jgi:hypothetical protein
VLVNRSFVRVPVNCGAPKGTFCVGTIRVITGKNRTVASGPLSVSPGSHVVKLRPRISVARISKKVTVRVRTYGANGEVAKFQTRLKTT